jgi:Protein of unknown function (DUF3551)
MRATITTLLLGAVAVLAIAPLTVSPARADIEYPWCAQYGGGRNGLGATNCGFVTLAQCRATVSGVGGFCLQNPMYPGVLNPPRRRQH